MSMKYLAAAALAAAVLGLSVPHNPAVANNDGEDAAVVTEWNQLLQDTIPATAALQSPRYYAMLHIAMFDAVNSIERSYKRYRAMVSASRGASGEAAAAQAAHDILVALLPESQPTYDAALAQRLETIEPGRARQGIRVGQAIAQRILSWRQNDGWSDAPPPYVLPPLPGLWQPTPPGFIAATFTQFPDVEPFALLTSTQYLPTRPPTLTSEEYADDFNEVKELGSSTSTVRTAEQTLLARLFAGVGYGPSLFALWNNIAGETSQEQGYSLIETARLFAQLNASINDGLQTSHTSKFIYGLWRPVTAIQRADEDLNPLTTPDPTWTSFLVTPPYPSHSGNMACVGASAARALELNFGANDIPLTARWVGAMGNLDVSLDYPGFRQLADDEALSRVYGGIHFTFESIASQESCVKVADYVFENYMTPKK